MEEVKEKGIVLHVKEALQKKHDDLKLRVLTSENHAKVLESSNKNKCDVLSN